MTTRADGWREVALGEVIAPISERVVPDRGTEIPFIGMEHVEAQSGRLLEYGDASVIKSASPLVEPGDVLYGRLRPYLNKVAIAPERAYTSGEFIVFRGNEQVDGRWLKWRFTAQDFVDYAISLNAGDRPRVRWPQMKPFELNLPPLDEQHRIVELLEDHLSRLDAAERDLKASIALTRRLRDSALAEAISEARAHPDSTVATIGDLALVTSGMTPLRSNHAFYEGGTIPWITSGDLSGGVVDSASQFVTATALSETSLNLVKSGAILLAMYGEGKTRGTAALLNIDATTNQACAAIQLHDPTLRPWVKAVLDSNYVAMRRMAAGGVQPNLNLSLVRSIQVPLPSPTVLEAALARVREIEEQAVILRAALGVSIRRSGNLRHALLAAAFSGRLSAGVELSAGAETIGA